MIDERVFLNPAGSHWAPLPTAPTKEELVAMCEENDIAYVHAQWLFLMAGVEFPPKCGQKE